MTAWSLVIHMTKWVIRASSCTLISFQALRQLVQPVLDGEHIDELFITVIEQRFRIEFTRDWHLNPRSQTVVA